MMAGKDVVLDAHTCPSSNLRSMGTLVMLIASCAFCGCSFPSLPALQGAPTDAPSLQDAPTDNGDTDAAMLPPTSVTFTLPGYVATGSTVDWHANLVGPAHADLDYALAVDPEDAAVIMPTAGSSSIGADGTVKLDATLTAGSTPRLATISVAVTGQTVGNATATVPVVQLRNIGFTGGGASPGDTTFNAGRLIAMPLHIASGTQIVGFGCQARSAVSLQLALYGASGSVPGALVVQSPIIHPQVGTVISYLPQPQTLTSDADFIAVATASNTTLLEDLASADQVTQYGVDVSFGAALPTPFGTASTVFSQGPFAIFIVVIAP